MREDEALDLISPFPSHDESQQSSERKKRIKLLDGGCLWRKNDNETGNPVEFRGGGEEEEKKDKKTEEGVENISLSPAVV